MLYSATLSNMAVLCKFSYESFRGVEISLSATAHAVARILATNYWRLRGITMTDLPQVDDRTLGQLKSFIGNVEPQSVTHVHALRQMKQLEILTIRLGDGNWAQFFQTTPFASIRVLTLKLARSRQDVDLRGLSRLTTLELVVEDARIPHTLFPEGLTALKLETCWLQRAQRPMMYETLPSSLEHLALRKLCLDSVDVLSHLKNLKGLSLSCCRILSSATNAPAMWTTLREFQCGTENQFSEWPFVVPSSALLTSLSWSGQRDCFALMTHLPVVRNLDLTVCCVTPGLLSQLPSFDSLTNLSLIETQKLKVSSLRLNEIFAVLPNLKTFSGVVKTTPDGDIPTLSSETLLFLELRVWKGSDGFIVRFGHFQMPKLRCLTLLNSLAVGPKQSMQYVLAGSLKEPDLPNLRRVWCRDFNTPDRSLFEQLARLPQKPTACALKNH